MRIRKSWILIAGLLTWFGWGRFDELWDVSMDWLRGVDQTGYREDATRHTTILLTNDRWTEFQLSPHATTLRALTNAALREMPDDSDADPRCHYSIAYQILDADDKVIHKSTYHFYAKVKLVPSAETGKDIAIAFFAATTLIPSQTSTMQVPLEPLDGIATRVRLRLVDHDPNIGEVVVRVLGRQERMNFDESYTWRRLSRNRREHLCRTSVYTQDLLTPQERRNLLRWQWTPTPPIGIEGVDYEQRVMYVIKEVIADGLPAEVLPPGVLAKPNLRAVIPIPDNPGVLQLEFEEVDELDASCPVSVVARWFGTATHMRQTSQFPLDQQIQTVEMEVAGGLVEVQSSNRIVVRAHWRDSSKIDGEPIDITPQERRIRPFITAGQPIEYEISHVGDRATPFRLDVRRVMDSPEADAEILWTFSNEQGEAIDQGTLAIESSPSNYEQMLVQDGTDRVSDPATFFFSIPKPVTRIQLLSRQEPLLVSGFCRPPRMPKLTRVPTDYQAFHLQSASRPTWFGLRPDGHETLIQNNRSVPIRIQFRPPQDDADILAGRYEWEDYQPSGLWKARHLLLPHDPNRLVRDESLPVIYHELKPNVRHKIEFVGDKLRQWIPPNLIYVRTKQGSNKLSVNWNDELIMETTMRSSRGEIELPQQRTGTHGHLQINADDTVRVFVRNTQSNISDEKPRYLKRLAHKFEKGHLRFDYEKQSHEKEVVMLRLYRNDEQSGSSRIRVNIETNNRVASPTKSWTIKRRVFDLRPTESSQAIVLGADENVDVGQVCYLSIGEDIPPGLCTIDIRSDNDCGGYVVLYRTTPGLGPRRNVLIEYHNE